MFLMMLNFLRVWPCWELQPLTDRRVRRARLVSQIQCQESGTIHADNPSQNSERRHKIQIGILTTISRIGINDGARTQFQTKLFDLGEYGKTTGPCRYDARHRQSLK